MLRLVVLPVAVLVLAACSQHVAHEPIDDPDFVVSQGLSDDAKMTLGRRAERPEK